jgi:hypothetical protein
MGLGFIFCLSIAVILVLGCFTRLAQFPGSFGGRGGGGGFFGMGGEESQLVKQFDKNGFYYFQIPGVDRARS